MSNKKKAAGPRGRHTPQHRKEPSWTVGNLAAMPSGLGAKIVIAGVAGATLAIPATSAFASPSSIAVKPGSPLITFSHQATHHQRAQHQAAQHQGTQHQGTQHQRSQHQGTDQGQATEQHQSQHMRHSPLPPTAGQTGSGATGGSASMPPAGGTVAPSNSADSASPGPGLLLEPDGTFVTLPLSASNVQTVPAGSLIITSNGVLVNPPVGTYATPYGLITVAQTPGSGTPSASTATPGTATPGTTMPGTAAQGTTTPGTVAQGTTTPGTSSVNPGGPMQTPPQQPAPAPAPVTTPGPAPVTTPHPVMTPGPAPVMIPAPATGVGTTAKAPPAAAKPPVQVLSALGGVTVADNGTVTPTGSVNLAFPGSGIGGSLPLSLPSAAAAQPTQPAFRPADQNVALADPIFQGLIQNLGQQAQPPVSLPAPMPDLSPSTAPATTPANPNAAPSDAVRLASLDNGVLSDAPPPGSLMLAQAAQNTATQPQGSILMVQPSIFGSPTIKPLNPGTDMTLSDGTRLQVTNDNYFQITPPGGDLHELAPGNTYTLPDGSGNQIVVPTVPPVLLQDPGNGDTILTPGSHISLGSGGSVDVTQDGVLRVTTPDGHQADYAPGSSFTLPGGVTISPMTPPQAMNLDQNPATQLASAASTGSQVAANGFDANGNPVTSDASQLPVQLAQNQAPMPSLIPDSLTVILPDGTPQTFPLGTSTNPLAPPTFGQGNQILVPSGTQVPLPGGGSTTVDGNGKLIFPGNPELPAIQSVPAMPTSDNSPAGTTAVAMNNVNPADTQPPAGTTQPPAATTPAPADTQPPAATTPVPADTQPPADVAPPSVVAAQPPADTQPPAVTPPAPADVAPAPVPAPADVVPAPVPAPVTVASSGGFTSSDPSAVGPPPGAGGGLGGSSGGGYGGGSGGGS